MKNVAMLLNDDAESLYNAWAVTWKETGKSYADYSRLMMPILHIQCGKLCSGDCREMCGDKLMKWVALKIG